MQHCEPKECVVAHLNLAFKRALQFSTLAMKVFNSDTK